MSRFEDATKELDNRFGKDSLLSIATLDGDAPAVRSVDGYYADGAIYVVTYTLSGKMQQIAKDNRVAVCGDWFTARGIGENLGHVLADENKEMMAKLREVFSAWYTGGHVNESDKNTCLLRVRLTSGVLFDNGTKYDIDFVNQTA